MKFEKKKLIEYLAFATFLFSVLFTLYMIIFVERGYYHADCTDSLMWAEASFDTKALVNPDFNYAGLMPIAGNVIMWPLVAIFGVGMKAQIIGLVIFFILFVLAIISACEQLKFKNSNTMFAIAIALFLLSSSEKLREIFWGHIIYYSFGPLMFFAVFAAGIKLYHKLQESMKIKPLIPMGIVLFILSFICGINGTQIACLSSVPIAVALVAYLFFKRRKLFDKNNLSIYIPFVISAVGTLVGMLFIKVVARGVTAAYADAYSGFGDMDNWMSALIMIPSSLFELMGIKVNSSIELFSFSGIIILIKVVAVLVLFVTPIVMLFKYRKIKRVEHKIFLLAHHFTALVILIGWVFGKLSSAEWRLSPLIVSASICCAIYASQFIEVKASKRMALIIAVPLLLMSFITVVQVMAMNKQSVENKSFEKVVKHLEEKNLKYGYGSFWNANVLTMISDSKVKVRDVKFDSGKMMPNDYQTNKNWYKNAPKLNEYFVLMTSNEYSQYYEGQNSSSFGKPKEIYNFDNYVILIYDHNLF